MPLIAINITHNYNFILTRKDLQEEDTYPVAVFLGSIKKPLNIKVELVNHD